MPWTVRSTPFSDVNADCGPLLLRRWGFVDVHRLVVDRATDVDGHVDLLVAARKRCQLGGERAGAVIRDGDRLREVKSLSVVRRDLVRARGEDLREQVAELEHRARARVDQRSESASLLTVPDPASTLGRCRSRR